MTGIILTMASAGVMCVAGIGVSSALKWFHTYEPNMDRKKKEEPKDRRERPHGRRLREVERKIEEDA